MLTITLQCSHCQSDALIRDGHAPNGKQKDRCHTCGRRSRENPTPNAYPETRREEIVHTYQERSSLPGLTRTDRGFRVLPCPVGSKKRSAPSSLTDHLARPGPKGFHFHDTGTRRALVVCAQKSARLQRVDCLVSPDATGSRLCDR